jgi:hypothetical protein
MTLLQHNEGVVVTFKTLFNTLYNTTMLLMLQYFHLNILTILYWWTLNNSCHVQVWECFSTIFTV